MRKRDPSDHDGAPGAGGSDGEGPRDADAAPDAGISDWCEVCRRHVEDEDALAEGSCPECGEPLERRKGLPWSFRLMIVATVVYLGYRTYQLIGWAIHHA